MLTLHRTLDNNTVGQEPSRLSSDDVLIAVFNAARQAYSRSSSQDSTVSQEEAADAGLAIIGILNSTLKRERQNTPTSKNEYPRGAPAKLGASGSPFNSSSCPSRSNTPGNTPGQNSSTNDFSKGFGRDNGGSSDDQALDTQFPDDTFGDPKKIEEPGVFLACPYRKHSRDLHTAAEFPECAAARFESSYEGITKLKRHIERYHSLRDSYPDACDHECPRCGKGFNSTDEVKAHARPEVCPVRPRRIGRVRMMVLQSGRKEPPGRSWVKKWISIFRLCFPEFKAEDAANITYCWSILLPTKLSC